MSELDLTEHLERERMSDDLKTSLLDVYKAQDDLIYAQQEAVMRLLHENVEQENMINELLHNNV
ncbi:hypothetical protein HMPREF9372_3337 [Sporosarcina newyorkensis 2681]|uniref:Uncharacterized protein n=1 Tax=Sporosarcina newyorkensis 2681 TaxID=1027292 RepID=F9DX06_9BACL|nr:hypothetical protein HMPREF9372_3337 [Sporosarcina newyorkensis 2681]